MWLNDHRARSGAAAAATPIACHGSVPPQPVATADHGVPISTVDFSAAARRAAVPSAPVGADPLGVVACYSCPVDADPVAGTSGTVGSGNVPRASAPENGRTSSVTSPHTRPAFRHPSTNVCISPGSHASIASACSPYGDSPPSNPIPSYVDPSAYEDSSDSCGIATGCDAGHPPPRGYAMCAIPCSHRFTPSQHCGNSTSDRRNSPAHSPPRCRGRSSPAHTTSPRTGSRCQAVAATSPTDPPPPDADRTAPARSTVGSPHPPGSRRGTTPAPPADRPHPPTSAASTPKI